MCNMYNKIDPKGLLKTEKSTERIRKQLMFAGKSLTFLMLGNSTTKFLEM